MASRINRLLEQFSESATRYSGSSWAFALAAALIIVWILSGPMFGFSDTWQLVINTGTTIVTFLMVFLIQRSQNRDALAVQLKLDEIVSALESASNRLISVEDLSEEELMVLRIHYQHLAELAKHDMKIAESHSIEEAVARHNFKKDRRRKVRP